MLSDNGRLAALLNVSVTAGFCEIASAAYTSSREQGLRVYHDSLHSRVKTSLEICMDHAGSTHVI